MGFGRNIEIQDGGARWPPLKNDDVIPTSSDVIDSFCGRQRQQFVMCYLPTEFHCHSFNALEVLRGEICPHPQGSGTKKKPREVAHEIFATL